jgi:hypothetical protein
MRNHTINTVALTPRLVVGCGGSGNVNSKNVHDWRFRCMASKGTGFFGLSWSILLQYVIGHGPK